jgi:hypothetical protein
VTLEKYIANAKHVVAERAKGADQHSVLFENIKNHSSNMKVPIAGKKLGSADRREENAFGSRAFGCPLHEL